MTAPLRIPRWAAALVAALALCLPAWAHALAADVQAIDLPSGTTVLVRHEGGTELVGICVFIRTQVGSDAREPGDRQIAARALFGSSAFLPAESVTKEIDLAGGSLQVRCEPDFTVITCVTTAAAFDDAFYVVSQAIKNAQMDEDALRRAVTEAEAEMRAQEADPYFSAYAIARQTLYRESPYRLPFTAAPAAPLKVTRQGVLDYFQRHYTPIRTVVSIAGGITVDAVRRTLDVQLAAFDRRSAEGAGVPRAVDAERPTEPLRARRVKPIRTAIVLSAYPGPGLKHKDYAAFSVLGAILGGGKGSRLFRRVRDMGALGYDVGAETPPLALESQLIAHVEFDPSRTGPSGKAPTAAEAEQMVGEVVHSVLTEAPTDAEIARAKQYLIGRHLVAHQRMRDRAYYLGWYETVGLGYEFDTDWPKAIEAVTPADLKRLATECLANGVTVTVRPEK